MGIKVLLGVLIGLVVQVISVIVVLVVYQNSKQYFDTNAIINTTVISITCATKTPSTTLIPMLPSIP